MSGGAERLREMVAAVSRSYPDDGPEYWRACRDNEWLRVKSRKLALALADMEEALVPARDLIAEHADSDGGYAAVLQVIDAALARLAALLPEREPA